MTTEIEIPEKLVPVFEPARGEVRYRGAYGGRGSAKSVTFATMAAVYGLSEPLRVLCTREFQNSIKESFYAELKDAINKYDFLSDFYELGENFIRGANGTEFLFKGLRFTKSIKSFAKTDICIVEEAEDVPENSWKDLTPTIRKPGSEIWVIWNPEQRGSATDKRYRLHPPDRSIFVELNHGDNPWFPPELEEERKRDERLLDPNTYAHVWEGAYLENSDKQILGGKWRVDEFTPGDDWDGPYHGLDWGFSQDPLAVTKCWIHNDRLFVERESGGIGIEIDATAEKVKRDIPGIENYEVLSDNARPENINYVQRHGLPRCLAAKKWPGSVADGIAFMRSFKEIVIHPRCKEVKKEARLYSYKVDAKSGQVLADIVDANNHYIDSIRYGLQPMIRSRPTGSETKRLTYL